MLQYFDHEIPNDILLLDKIFRDHNHELRLVGGAVRDAFRNKKVSDFDLATSASPDQISAIFQDLKQYYLIPTGISHGTWTIVFNKIHYEITSYRVDGSYSNNRHPDQVSFTNSLIEDLSRRDFTINAIAVDPSTREIFDPFNGQEDIKQQIIRTVGEPDKRFQEDALRMLRACRFASKLEYTIENSTFEAIKSLHENILSVSNERIRDEIMKIIESDNPIIGIEYMRKSNLLTQVLPELEEGYEVSQNEFHKYDVYWHNLKTCFHMPKKDPLARLAALLHDIGKPRSKKYALKIGNGNVFYNHEIIGAKMTKHIMKRLKFSNDDIAKCTLLVELHMFYYTNEWNDGAIRRFLRRFDGDLEFLQLLFELREADRNGSGTKKSNPYILQEFKKRIHKILEEDAALKVSDLHINGTQLIELFQLTPSPIIGKILNHLLELVLDDPTINEYEQLKSEVALFLESYKNL